MPPRMQFPSSVTNAFNSIHIKTEIKFPGMHFLVHVLSLVQFILCLSFGIWAATKHNASDVQSSHWDTTRSTAPAAWDILAVNQKGDADIKIQSCNNLITYTLRDYHRCAMTKLPISFTHLNTQYALWPGKSMNESYLIFVLAMIHAMFAVVNFPLTQPGTHRFLGIRSILISSIQIALLVITGIAQWEWGAGLSSTFFGTVMIIMSITLTWSFVYQERSNPIPPSNVPALSDSNPDGHGGKGVSSIEFALQTQQTYTIHLLRSMCTFPIVVFIVLMHLAPYQLDFTYIVPLFTSFLICYGQILLESKLLVRSQTQQFNFKTEKVAYLVAVTFFFLAFLFSFSNETFYPAWNYPYASTDENKSLYMLLFVMKTAEFGISLVLYAMDDGQTYTGVDTRVRLVADWSNVRYLLFTLTDMTVVLWLMAVWKPDV